MRSKAGGDRLSFVEFQLPTLVDEPPEGDGWIHEIKYDGYRTQLVIERGEARAFTRNGHDWSAKYAPIVEAAEALPLKSAIIDGEAIVMNEAGLSDFGKLRSAIRWEPGQHRLRRLRPAASRWQGSAARVPTIERKAALEKLVDSTRRRHPVLPSHHRQRPRLL